MFTRFFSRIAGQRRLWADYANLGERRVAGVHIAFFGR